MKITVECFIQVLAKVFNKLMLSTGQSATRSTIGGQAHIRGTKHYFTQVLMYPDHQSV